ncbi:MAG: hypothetical protein WCF85_13265 [Rhodospirillaceae bacterium]
MMAGTGLALFSTLAALSPWSVGLWPESEPIANAVHAGAALAGLGLSGIALHERALVLAVFAHPFVFIPLLAGGWGLVAAIGAGDGAQALLGSPQTAEGPLLFFDIALFTAAGMLMSPGRLMARAAGWAALVAGAGIPLLSLSPHTEIYFFGAWMVFLAISAPVIVVICFADSTRRHRLLLAGLAGFPGLALSGSNTAIAAGLLVIPAVWLLSNNRGEPEASRHVTLLFMTGAVVIPALLWLLTMGCAAVFGSVKPDVRAVESLWSRGHLHMVLLADFIDRPRLWLVGAGWGQIADLFSRNITAAGVILWDGSWDMTRRDIVNSHHAAFEGFLAAGLPGLALRLAGLAMLPLVCRHDRVRAAGLFALSLSTLGAMWFQLPGTVAAVAFATGLLAAPPVFGNAGSTLPPFRRKVAMGLAPAVLALAGLQITTALVLTRQGLVAASLVSDYIEAQQVPPAVDCDEKRLSGWRAEANLALLLGKSLQRLRLTRAPDRLSEPALRALSNLLCLSDRPYFRDSARIQPFVLALRSDILRKPVGAPYRERFSGIAEDMDRRALDYLTRVPRRTDMVMGVLSWLAETGQSDRRHAMIERMLAIAPENPVALWASGSEMIRQHDPETVRLGEDRLRRAQANGLERLVPVNISGLISAH